MATVKPSSTFQDRLKTKTEEKRAAEAAEAAATPPAVTPNPVVSPNPVDADPGRAEALKRSMGGGETIQFNATNGSFPKSPPPIDQNTIRQPFELQRENIQAEGVDERQAANLRLQEELAARGFGQGSGFLEKNEQAQDLALRKLEGGRLSAVDIAEAGAISNAYEAERGRDFQMDLQSQINDFSTGRINLQNTLNNQNVQNKAVAEGWFAKGTDPDFVADPAELDLLRRTNPTAYAMYEAGQSGLSKQEADRLFARETQLQNAAILDLETADDDFMEQLLGLYEDFGIPVPEGFRTTEGEGEGEGGFTPDTRSLSVRRNELIAYLQSPQFIELPDIEKAAAKDAKARELRVTGF